MKKCIVIPDSYKGTLSAIQICDIMKEVILKHFPDCEVITIPIADGGEGTLDCFLYSLDAKKIVAKTTNPYNEEIIAAYARKDDTAIIEMALAAGLLQAEGRLNPCRTTTFGVGTLIRHAVTNGCKKIVIGLGGSCTNDGGVGMAAALGTIFYNVKGEEFLPSADTLHMIHSIDNSKTKELLKDCEITAMCDITNPLCGKMGASYIFAPQKGADEDMVKLLDENLFALSRVILTSLQKEVLTLPGSGAAGGMGAGIVGFLNGQLKSGIDMILELIRFQDIVENTDLIFTGEGQIDYQSLHGKVISGIAKVAKPKNIPVIVVAGSIGKGAEEAYSLGVQALFSTNRTTMLFEEAKLYAKENLEKTMNDILRLYKCAL